MLWITGFVMLITMRIIEKTVDRLANTETDIRISYDLTLEAWAYLQEEKEKKFDPELVDIFLKKVLDLDKTG